MKREKMITRTIEVTKAFYTALDVETQEVLNNVISFTGHYDTETALKKAKNSLDSDTFKVVVVTDVMYTEKLYGMSEIDFLENAVELDPETRKPL